jgi:hypothetical protein
MPAMSQEEILAVAHQDLSPKGSYAYAPTAELVVYPEMVEVQRHTGRRNMALITTIRSPQLLKIISSQVTQN